MLKQSNHKAGDIVSVVLTTGQELITKLVEENQIGGVLTVRQPLSLVIGPDGQGGFQPFSITGDSDKEVEIKLAQVISVMQTRKEIASAYSATTSGLVVPESGLIKG